MLSRFLKRAIISRFTWKQVLYCQYSSVVCRKAAVLFDAPVRRSTVRKTLASHPVSLGWNVRPLLARLADSIVSVAKAAPSAKRLVVCECFPTAVLRGTVGRYTQTARMDVYAHSLHTAPAPPRRQGRLIKMPAKAASLRPASSPARRY